MKDKGQCHFYFNNLTLPLGSALGVFIKCSSSQNSSKFTKTKKAPRNSPPSLGPARNPWWIHTRTSIDPHLILSRSADWEIGTMDQAVVAIHWGPTNPFLQELPKKRRSVDPIFRSAILPKDRWRIHTGRGSAFGSLGGGMVPTTLHLATEPLMTVE